MGTRGSYEAWSQTGHAHEMGIAACEDHTDLLLIGFCLCGLVLKHLQRFSAKNMGTSDDNTQWLCIVAASCDGNFSKGMVRIQCIRQEDSKMNKAIHNES